jgi:hypothetical protein
MRLPGRLCATTLGDLLGELHRGRASGVLELVESAGATAGRRHRVHFDSGLVERVETPVPVERLGEILRREGFIGEEGARVLARRLLERPDRLAGQLLLDEKLTSSAAVVAALRYQMRARLDTLFSIQQALVHFHVARRRRRPQEWSIPLSPHEFLHGRARTRDRDAERPPGRTRPSRGRHGGNSARRRALSLLGLHEAADRRAVQRAFRRLAAELHPDRHPGASPGEMASLMRGFAELTAAYHELVAE